MNLQKIRALSEKDRELLTSYSIVTIEQFLGATFGVTNMSILDLLSDKEGIIEEIKMLYSEEKLKEYREGYELPAMGCHTEGGEING